MARSEGQRRRAPIKMPSVQGASAEDPQEATGGATHYHFTPPTESEELFRPCCCCIVFVQHTPAARNGLHPRLVAMGGGVVKVKILKEFDQKKSQQTRRCTRQEPVYACKT